ncbi:SDR family oxidoreductase [Nocardia sp. NPDC059246]|uniref:SDR family oxidoreductase n=1 Tax=unclassified Nocardia TaxID=2637762 RepID=UPI0036AAAF37
MPWQSYCPGAEPPGALPIHLPLNLKTEKVATHMPEVVRQQVAALHPLRRMGLPADVAQAALFLASDASSYLSGITIDVAGGRITN